MILIYTQGFIFSKINLFRLVLILRNITEIIFNTFQLRHLLIINYVVLFKKYKYVESILKLLLKILESLGNKN